MQDAASEREHNDANDARGVHKRSPATTPAIGPCPNGWDLQFSAKHVKVVLVFHFFYNFRYLKFIREGDYWLSHMVYCNRPGGNFMSITSESANAETACKGPLDATAVERQSICRVRG